jgi:hypothetical protein
MTAKEKVRAVFPHAVVKSYRNPQGLVTHYIVWSTYGDRTRLGDGKTSAAAWKDAATHSLPKIE